MKIRLMFLVVLMILNLISCQKEEQLVELSSEDVVKIITDYIKHKIDEDGTFVIEDNKESRNRELEYVKIYEPVQKTEAGDYFTCVDFTNGEDRLDVDFYVTKANGKPKVSEVVIHMVNGETREK